MKKLVLPFLLVTLFFIKTETVSAEAAYTYDINSVSYSNATNSLTIEGWAFISNNEKLNIHNIQPKYTLRLEGKTKDGKVVASKTYGTDLADKPPFLKSDANPHDFTKAYFIKHTSPVTGVYLTYPDPSGGEARAYAIINSDHSYGNVFAINIDFKFAIPISDLVDLARKGSQEVYLYLTSTLSGPTSVTVYGKSFSRTYATKDMQLAIFSDRINNIDKDKTITATITEGGKSTTYNMRLGVNYLTDSITNISVLGQGRGSWDLDHNTYWYLIDGVLQSGPNKFAGTPVYYYSTQQGGGGEALATYKRIWQRPAESLQATSIKNWSYQVNIHYDPLSANCFSSKRCVANGGSSVAWISAYWARPFKSQGKGTALVIEIVDNNNTCTLKPECATDKLGTGSTCPVYDSSNPANSECCKSICSIEANKNTNFCTKVCKSDPIPPNPCDDITDDQKQYCCKYPEDPSCSKDCKQDPTIKNKILCPDNEPPVNKSGTCTDTGLTSIDFKYPSEGGGKTLLTNSACSISCQETLRSSFNPKISVKAGMGFAYPINIESSRYCTAKYDNDGWKKKVDDAVVAANTAYNAMVAALNSAKSLDSTCGKSYVRKENAPSCSSPYTSRSGLTCSCTKCIEDWDECSDTCPYEDWALVNGVWTKTGSGTKPCQKPCNQHWDDGSSSLSCPNTSDGLSTSYVSGDDKCEVTVCENKQSWLYSSAQDDIQKELDKAQLARTEYERQISIIDRLNGDRNTCDNYVSSNTYNGANGTMVSVNVPNQDSYAITGISRSEDADYESGRSSTSTNYAIYQCNNKPYYPAPTLVGDHSASSYSGTYCNFQTVIKTYKDFWNKKSDANLTLEFAQGYYVQQYTGNLSTGSGNGYDSDGRKSYTDFYDYSGVNDFSLSLTKLGPNLPTITNNLWSIDPFSCQYDITNWIFPPSDDPKNSQYSKVAFRYRQISLTDPFPNRSPGENWRDNVSLITSKGYSIYENEPLYTITLNPQSMQGIRDYNRTHNYGSFNPNHPYRSDLIHSTSYWGVFIKERSGS